MLSRRRPACLGAAALRLVLRIERAGDADRPLRLVPDLLIGEIAEDRGEQQEDRRPRDPPRGGSRGSARPSTPGMRRRPSPSGRRSAWCRRRVGHLAVAGQRRRHRDVEVREIGIEVKVRRRLGVRELAFSSSGRLVLIAGQQRIDVGRAAFARLGDQRQVGRKRIVVGRARRDLVGERRREMCRTAAPCGSPARRCPG